jgi:dihydroorotase
MNIISADDFHHHLRDGDKLATLVPAVATQFCRAIVMPNLRPPVTTTADALAYRERIMACVPDGVAFEPLMTLYLTDRTTPEMIREAKASGVVKACKLYPAGATTNSDSGVTDIALIMPALAAMAEEGLILCVHGEVTDPTVDVFDREALFIEQKLRALVDALPALKIVMEHITTKQAAEFVASAPANVAATITPQHMLYNRNAIFQGGVRPHMYCLPILKRELHREALVVAATSGSSKFFLGTDSAPHEITTKERGCGCAGIFSAFAALALYTEVFDKAGALDKLEAFASKNGAAFYGLPLNEERTLLTKETWTVPTTYPLGTDGGVVVPLRAGEQLAWRSVRQSGSFAVQAL